MHPISHNCISSHVRLLALLLISFLLLALIGCADGSGDETALSTDLDENGLPTDLSFQGETVRILAFGTESGILRGDSEPLSVSRALYERATRLKERFGISLSVTVPPSSLSAEDERAFLADLRNNVNSDSGRYDFFLSPLWISASAATNGLTSDLLSLPYFETDGDALSSLSLIGDRLFFYTDAFDPTFVRSLSCVVANEGLLEHSDELLSLCANGEFTLECLFRFAEEACAGDATMGLAVSESDVLPLLLGRNVTSMDSAQGALRMNERLGSALEELYQIFLKETGGQTLSCPEIGFVSMKAGTLGFVIADIGSAFALRNAADPDVELMVLPLPKRDATQPTYRTAIGGDARGWAVLPGLSEERYALCGALLSYLAGSEQQRIATEFAESFYDTASPSEQDKEALFLTVVDSACFDFGIATDEYFAFAFQNAIRTSIEKGYGPVAVEASMQSLSKAMKPILEEINARLREQILAGTSG